MWRCIARVMPAARPPSGHVFRLDRVHGPTQPMDGAAAAVSDPPSAAKRAPAPAHQDRVHLRNRFGPTVSASVNHGPARDAVSDQG
jgi:hypothetical protein